VEHSPELSDCGSAPPEGATGSSSCHDGWVCDPALETLFLDTETTGLRAGAGGDEVLEIGIVDADDRVLFESFVRPLSHTEWPEAEDLHGIAPAAVAAAPTLEALRPCVQELVRGKRVVIYNACFELSFLPWVATHAAEVRCCMQAYADYVGDWSEYHGNNRWQSLSVAAGRVEHALESAHRAVADARACRAVWRFLTEAAEQARITAIQEAREYERAAYREERFAWEQHQCRMSRWWMRWWRFPLFLDGRDGRGCPGWTQELAWRADEYALLFYGAPVCVLERQDQLGRTLTHYAKRAAVPPQLRPIHAFRREPQWLRDALEPAGYLLRSTAVSWLYDIRQVAGILEHYPLRRPYVPRPGHVLVPKTALRKAGFQARNIEALQPCQIPTPHSPPVDPIV
jgi:DNA polymerase III epsilon subunit-like protein